jgi:hypothetical protein
MYQQIPAAPVVWWVACAEELTGSVEASNARLVFKSQMATEAYGRKYSDIPINLTYSSPLIQDITSPFGLLAQEAYPTFEFES